eukprot:CAMPEP_0181474470 /NCGR_PEP_ID=MMETSP1110-20121109/40674_1 /TAXON_ID=174948 /ORGANISM="Symbiodinium sp., Strain CCMP421" /LENGTH=68 /DNA_ID=CAMNT_0023599655 /DNA_START=103 /DNA_END=309 /DNA_ORIENTATION=+
MASENATSMTTTSTYVLTSATTTETETTTEMNTTTTVTTSTTNKDQIGVSFGCHAVPSMVALVGLAVM